MDDNFYNPVSNSTGSSPSLLLGAKLAILASPGTFIVTVLLFPVLIVIATRLLSGRSSIQLSKHKNVKSVRLPAYWLPGVGHGYQMLTEPLKFMSKQRNKSLHGAFALNLGAVTHNIISDPSLVTNFLEQEASVLSYDSVSLTVAQRFFGIPKSSLPKYRQHGAELTKHLTAYLLQEPSLSKISHSVTRQLELNIPQMLSFLDTDIDLQPWERRADSSFVSSSETEINLMSLMRDMMGNASVPAIFGHALLEKYPDILHEVYTMDEGMWFFLIGLPSWFPWTKSVQAHLARQRVWRCMDDYQRALDAAAKEDELDSTWGDLDDVSELILKRNQTYQEGNFEIKERGDTSIIWALATKSNMLVYWNILHVLSTPGLLARIRAEIAPFITISKPLSIGSFSEAPKLSISQDGLTTKCPLLRSCYLETLRLTSAAHSVRKVEADFSLSLNEHDSTATSFAIKKGEYLTIPHALHMQNPKYFTSPREFIPDRFLVSQDNGNRTIDTKNIRPYGGGASMCKGRLFAETKCLALVAGVLAYYDIEPRDPSRGWVVPQMQGRGGVAKPVGETRVMIKRREFDWDLDEKGVE